MGDSKADRMKRTDSEKEKVETLKKLVLENEEALNQCIVIMKLLYETGILQSTQTMLQPNETNKDNEQTEKLLRSLSKGFKEADQHTEKEDKMKIFDLLQLLNDPDINRAVRYFVYFLKGVGKGLKEQ